MKALQKQLVIDSATPYLYLAIYEEETLLDSHYVKGENDHSVTLMDELAKMLKRQGISPEAISKIIIGIGPGSYTGLRIGVVVAKMLGWSLNIPVYTVSSLALLASSQNEEGIILPWMDARRGYAFLGLYALEMGKIKQISKDEYTNLERYQKALTHHVSMVAEGEPDMLKLFQTDLIQLVEDIHLLAPIYLRETEAERNLASGNK